MACSSSPATRREHGRPPEPRGDVRELATNDYWDLTRRTRPWRRGGGEISTAAQQYDDEAMSMTKGVYRSPGRCLTRPRVEAAHGELQPAETEDASGALAIAVNIERPPAHSRDSPIVSPEMSPPDASGHPKQRSGSRGSDAAGGAHGSDPLKVFDDGLTRRYPSLRSVQHSAIKRLDETSSAGAALSPEEAIAYAQRGARRAQAAGRAAGHR